MSKGITPVIAIILMLLITIAVIGYATGFFQTLISTAGGQAISAANQTATRLQKTIELIPISGSAAVTVRNAGNEDITAAIELTVLVNGVPQTCGWTTATISTGQTTTCTYAPACTTGDTILVAGPVNTVDGLCP